MADKIMTITVENNLAHDIERCDGCKYLCISHQTNIKSPDAKIPCGTIIATVKCGRYGRLTDDSLFIEGQPIPCERDNRLTSKPRGYEKR
jgi:hypothetical protein